MIASPIVLIHGLIGHQSDSVLMEAFSPRKTAAPMVLAPELIGYGNKARKDKSVWNLDEQVDHLVSEVKAATSDRVHFVGHSVGGAIGAIAAFRYPDLVRSLTLVEGNFTLDDAFWCSKFAEMDEGEVESILTSYKANYCDWLESAGVEVSERTSKLALSWLNHQTAHTIRTQARAVVTTTSEADYLRNLRSVFDSNVPVSLIGGARSVADWDVPDWANQQCSVRVNVAGAGHLMMADSPSAYAEAVMSIATYHETLDSK